MSYPATRVLAMLELLQARQQLGGAELAERLDVDQRTVRRYAARLAELGIPVTAERGRYGGYRLMPGFKLPPLTRLAWPGKAHPRSLSRVQSFIRAARARAARCSLI